MATGPIDNVNPPEEPPAAQPPAGTPPAEAQAAAPAEPLPALPNNAPESPAAAGAPAVPAEAPPAAAIPAQNPAAAPQAPVAVAAAVVPPDTAPGGGGGNGGGGGGGNGGRINIGAIPAANLSAASVSAVQAVAVTGQVVPSAVMTIGKKLTLWLLSIVAGSILLLVLYVWRMDVTAGDDVRRNYGKDLNREDVTLYLGRRLANFQDALQQAHDLPAFAVSDKAAADEKALIETLNIFPSVISNVEKDTLETCVSLISVPGGEDRKAKLEPCVALLKQTMNQGMTAAAAAFSFQMASEASAKLLEQRQSLHEFWLKAAQLILLNLLLPVLTAVLGYTFGNQTQQQQQQQGQQ